MPGLSIVPEGEEFDDKVSKGPKQHPPLLTDRDIEKAFAKLAKTGSTPQGDFLHELHEQAVLKVMAVAKT